MDRFETVKKEHLFEYVFTGEQKMKFNYNQNKFAEFTLKRVSQLYEYGKEIANEVEKAENITMKKTTSLNQKQSLKHMQNYINKDNQNLIKNQINEVRNVLKKVLPEFITL